jgi:hypothetical protein
MLKLLMKTSLTITIFLISVSHISGQYIRDLGYNPTIARAAESAEKYYEKSSGEKSIEFGTGFFEDFSDYYTEVYPRNDHWEDKYAWINSTFPDSMISLGVATLDAYDQYGYPYYSSSRKHVPADTLTSNPFTFGETPPSSLYLSFFYQAGGKGDVPEGIITNNPEFPGRDTLLLEIYYNDTVWIPLFKTLDNTTPHRFKQAIVQIPDSLIKDGFQFRFRNYVSLPNYPQGSDLGKFGNADQWHIDYIQLEADADTLELSRIKDITLPVPLLPTLYEYTAVPWRHYLRAISASENERTTIRFTARNFYANGDDSVTFYRSYRAYNLKDTSILNVKEDLKQFVDVDDYFMIEDYYRTGFNYNSDDTIGRLKVMTYISPEDIDQPRVNDTVIRYETYYDHYAYDDGTAEYGFGIMGEPEDLSSVAIRYRSFGVSNEPDLLRGVLIYFAKSIDSSTVDAWYRVSIRKNNDSLPSGEVLYESPEMTPDYSTGLNQFTRIAIDPPVPVKDTFYIVIEQLNGYLNIGYDINQDNLQKLYAYINHTWVRPYTEPGGSLMVRPSFGNYSIIPYDTREMTEEFQFHVYPNPVSDRLHFDLPENREGSLNIEIYDMMGRLRIHNITDELSLSVYGLRSGIYFLRISEPDGQTVYTTKFIKE